MKARTLVTHSPQPRGDRPLRGRGPNRPRLTRRFPLLHQNMSSTMLPPGDVMSPKLRKPLVILLLASGVFINGIDRVSISSAAPMIIKQFRLDPALMGVILSAFF